MTKIGKVCVIFKWDRKAFLVNKVTFEKRLEGNER